MDPEANPESGTQTPVVAAQRHWPRVIQLALDLLSGDFARKGYLAAVDQGLISVTNFLAAIILARAISPTQFGVYAVGFLALHLVRAAQEGLIVQPLSARGAAMEGEEFRAYASSTGLIQLALAVVTAGAAALGGWALTWLGNDTAGPTLFGLWFPFLVWQPQEYLRRTFYTRGDVGAAVMNTALASVVRLGVLGWLAARGALSGLAGLDAIAWGALVASLPGFWQARAYWTPRLDDVRATWRHNWSFGRWVLGGTLANWVALELYPILTAGMISFAAAGAYRALQNPVAPVHVLLRATDTLLTPRAARVYARGGYKELARVLRLTYLMAGLPALALLATISLFPEPLLRLLYGEAYVAYSSGMILMAIFYGLWTLYWPLQSAFKAVGRTPPIFVANLAAAGTMFTVGLGLIRSWGVYGTIGGQALNALVVSAVLWGVWAWRVRGERRRQPD